MLKVLSLFSGAGGLDIGLESTGHFETVGCIDAEDDCITTLRINKEHGRVAGTHDFLRNASIVNADLAKPGPALDRLPHGSFDVVVGGPPCQSFSVLGKRRGTRDARGSLVFSFMEAVERLQPRAVVFENVPGFESIDGGLTFTTLLNQSRALGYECWHGRLCAADYGDPTMRRRFFLVAVRDPMLPLDTPAPTHGPASQVDSSETYGQLFGDEPRPTPLLPYVTVADALFGLNDAHPSGSALNGHVAVDHRAPTVQRFRMLLPGERDVARRRNRLHFDRPALTLFAGGIKGKKQARTHIHPTYPRELTPRECARLHSFPDLWVFAGSTDSILTQVANSVPINLASAIGRMVASACCVSRK